jgi:ABC-type uncharacterized transport system fused permease/ATPase subunit
MNDRKRLFIIIISVSVGTLISIGLYLLRRGGNVTGEDAGTIATNFVFAMVIVVIIGVVLKSKTDKEDKMKK